MPAHSTSVLSAQDLRPGTLESVQARTEQVEASWQLLRAAAQGAVANSYSPYSKFPVGAAGLSDNGVIVVGTNVENASFGLTLCAECALVGDLVTRGEKRLVAVCVVGADGEYLAPCGRCRQVLYEFGGPEMLIDRGEGVTPLCLGDLLPGAFSKSDLNVGGGQ